MISYKDLKKNLKKDKTYNVDINCYLIYYKSNKKVTKFTMTEKNCNKFI